MGDDTKIRWQRYDPGAHDACPTLSLRVNGGGDLVTLELSWSIGPADASCWKRPLSLTITPVAPALPPDDVDPAEWHKAASQQRWETNVELSREDMRLIRDFLTSLLASPDLREEDEC